MSSGMNSALQARWPLPPSRGRVAFTLQPGGVVEVASPGPDDRGRKAAGQWTVAGKRLEIDAPGFSGTFEVETVSDDRLVVRRIRKER
jgi:hypothetical protein